MISSVSDTFAFAFLPTGIVFNQKIVVLAFDSWRALALLQSRLHEVWVRATSSTFKDDQEYHSSDCFETFPFPEDFEANPKLEKPGKEYYEFRAALMVRNNEGLTKTYNRFHDPNERSPDILRPRELHAAMDRAVLDAYGWSDLQPTCDFLLDYVEEEENEGGGRQRRKPYRYRWPDDFRDEVLARLLALNKERAEQERLSGAAAEKQPKKGGGRKAARQRPEAPGVF